VGLLVAALLLVLVALFRLPVNARTRGDRLRLSLDATTVLICAAAFLWQFVFEPQVRREINLAKVLGLLVVSVICLMAVLAVVKLMLAGTDAVDTRALRCLTVVVLVGAVGAAVVPVLADPRLAGASDLFTTGEAVVAALAGVIQAHHGGRLVAARKARRAYSIVPYLAVGAIDALLVVTTVRAGGQLPIVVAAVAATGIVVGRQWLAFHDNDALLRSLREHQELLRHQATHDPLTGLPNRALFNERLDLAFRPGGEPVTAILVDLDDFKTVNDTLGHSVGDGLLVEVGARLRAAVREQDLVARLGGDEFAVLLPGRGDGAAVEVAERILAEFEPIVQTHGYRLRAGASVGIAERGPDDDAESLLQHADIAMYAAKRSGKGQYSIYTAEAVDAGVRSFV
jgi:diguanylate cyclase (GGDEF)-like protein